MFLSTAVFKQAILSRWNTNNRAIRVRRLCCCVRGAQIFFAALLALNDYINTLICITIPVFASILINSDLGLKRENSRKQRTCNSILYPDFCLFFFWPVSNTDNITVRMCNYAIIIHSRFFFFFFLINLILYTLLFNHTMIDKTRGQRKQERERRRKKKKKLGGSQQRRGREREKKGEWGIVRERREKKTENKKTDNLLRYLLTKRENNRRKQQKTQIRETAATTKICMNHNKF